MVSAHIAEWIAEFVEDVVRLNPALLPAAAAVASPAAPAAAALQSPRPSPRLSRSHIDAARGGSGTSSADSRPAAELAGPRGAAAADAAAGSTDSKSVTVDAAAATTSKPGGGLLRPVDAALGSKTPPQPQLAKRCGRLCECQGRRATVSSSSLPQLTGFVCCPR
jgi:hypothetical protein